MTTRTQNCGPQRVLLLNAWHDLNPGDSAIADVCITVAKRRWPSAAIECRSMLSRRDPAYASWCANLSAAHPDVHFAEAILPEPPTYGGWRSFPAAARTAARTAFALLPVLRGVALRSVRRQLSTTSAVVIVGGSDLFALSGRARLQDLRLARLVLPSLEAARLGAHVHLWGHTLGPFETGFSRRLVTRLLQAATEVVVREERSRALVASLDPRVRVRLAPDLAFALSMVTARQDRTAEAGGRRDVLVAPRAYLHGGSPAANERLARTFAEIANEVLSMGLASRVVVVPQVGGPGDVEDDELIARMVVESAANGDVVLGPRGLGPRALQLLYGDARAVIAVRLHAAILAVSAGTPAFAVSYFTAKTEGVMAGIGYPNSWCEIGDLSVERVREWFDTDRNDMELHLPEIAKRLGGEVERALLDGAS